MLKRMAPLLAAVVVLLVAFRLRVGSIFLSTDNLIDLGQQITVNAILAFGMTLTILIGGIDLSVGAVVALVGSAAVSALSSAGDPGGAGALILAVSAGMAVAVAFGALNGALAACTRVPPFIITLATMWIARGCAYRFNDARPIPVKMEAKGFLTIGSGRIFGVVPVPIVIMLAAFAGMALLLHRTRFGQHLYAIGGNREAARFTGIRLVRHEVATYVICGMLAGVAGMIHASRLYSAEPGSGQGFELNAIAAAVVGGTSFSGGVGTMYGTLVGAVIIGILEKGLNQSGDHFSVQYIVKGGVILLAVCLDLLRRR